MEKQVYCVKESRACKGFTLPQIQITLAKTHKIQRETLATGEPSSSRCSERHSTEFEFSDSEDSIIVEEVDVHSSSSSARAELVLNIVQNTLNSCKHLIQKGFENFAKA